MANEFLTRDAILDLNDIIVKEITVLETIPVWGGRKLHIKQLTRGLQDEYMKRQFGSMKMKGKATGKSEQQEMSAPDLYGHDAFLVVNSACDAEGVLLFKKSDIDVLNNKSGEAIGWLAVQVLEFSNMREDTNALETTENDIKN